MVFPNAVKYCERVYDGFAMSEAIGQRLDEESQRVE